MTVNDQSRVSSCGRSVVADNSNLYDLEQALHLVNAVSEVPYTVNGLLKSACDDGHPRILCKVVEEIGLIHSRYELDKDSKGLISRTIQESIECFTGYFRLHDSSGGDEFLKGLAYSDQPMTGVSSIVKELSDGSTLDLAIADTDNCMIANVMLQQQWEESKYGYGEPEYISVGEYFPALPTLYIDEADLEVFIDVFIKGTKREESKAFCDAFELAGWLEATPPSEEVINNWLGQAYDQEHINTPVFEKQARKILKQVYEWDSDFAKKTKTSKPIDEVVAYMVDLVVEARYLEPDSDTKDCFDGLLGRMRKAFDECAPEAFAKAAQERESADRQEQITQHEPVEALSNDTPFVDIETTEEQKKTPVKSETKKRYENMQKRVNEVAERYKYLSHRDICTRLAAEFRCAPDTIRKNTKLVRV